jgi:hypothetical protein
MSYTKNKNKRVYFNKKTKKRVYFNKKTKKRKQRKQTKQTMQKKQIKQRNIKLIIKDLGKKTKKYKRIQYGCKSMKGGGPLFQPFSYVTQQLENSGSNFYNDFYGYNNSQYTIY